MERLLKRAGASRVSEGAKEALREVLEARGDELATDAIKYSEHAGRRTVLKEDIILAKK